MDIEIVAVLPEGGDYEGHRVGHIWCWREKKTGKIYKVKPPMMNGCSEATKFQSYQSPVDGRVINNEVERRDDLKRNNCVDARELDAPKIEQGEK